MSELSAVCVLHACNNFPLLVRVQVHFTEEYAVDTGGPSREFWRLFVEGVVDITALEIQASPFL